MRKLLAVTCVLLVALSSMAWAAEDNWRISVKADNGAGSSVGPAFQLGVGTATDPNDSANWVNWLNVPSDAILVAGVIPGYSHVYTRHIQAPGPPPKVWYLRVAGMPAATGNLIRMLWYTVNSSLLPPESVGGVAVQYRLRLVNNRGIPGAPANGTEWLLPTPTAHSTSPWYTGPTLPMLRLTSMNDSAMLSQAYALEFYQDVVPEPASIMTLSIGVGGLAGLALRRRRK